MISLTRATAFGNGGCIRHLILLRSFISLAGVPLDVQSLLPAGRPERDSTKRVGQPRSLSSTALLRTSNTLSLGHSDGAVDGGAQRSAEGANKIPPSATNAAPIPWYLQIDTPQAPLYPVSDRQRLPDMPVDPPPILEPLLKYVSIDLGLDDLSLFDLRKLDPPPALGSNLLMMLGTTRSERHLHVSADRLCRWLRSTYRLTPFADGLLGRNELKLKMRRKARRAKLLGTVGTSASSTADDGVRTGWVCVNVGTVEGGKASEEDTAVVPEIVGFGSRSTGVNIVIQMLTEEKRGELDLEELWGGVLKEQAQSPAVAMEHAQEIPNSTELRLATQVKVPTNSHRARFTASCLPQSKLSSRTQIRALHSESKVSGYDGNDENLDQSSGRDLNSVRTMSQSVADGESPSRAAALSVSGTKDQDLVRDQHRTLHNSLDKLSIWGHFNHLRSLTTDAALKALGQDINDTSSTSFLKSFYTKLSEESDIAQWKFKLELLSCGMKIDHEGYTKSNVAQMFKQIQGSSATSTRGILIKMLRLTVPKNQQGFATDSTYQTDLTRSVEILDELSRRGYMNLSGQLVFVLREASYARRPLRSSAEGMSVEVDAIRNSQEPRTVQERLLNHLATFTVNTISDDNYLKSLQSFSRKNRWGEFWSLWWKIPEWCPRSKAMYAEMFGSVAKRKQQGHCVKCLRRWVPEMDIEKPPVRLEGEVAMAVKKCLLVVHPGVEEDARKGFAGEWVSLWERCQSALPDSPETGVSA